MKQTTKIRRRTFNTISGIAAASALTADLFETNPNVVMGAERGELPLIIDTHQHLWDLEKFKLPWLDGAPEVLRQNYRTKEYLDATRGLNVKAIYMEVDVDPSQHIAEAEHVAELCKSDDHPTIAAVVGGKPASLDFPNYVKRLTEHPQIKGVRQVLHVDATAQGFCLQKEFIRGVRLLGERGLSFDLCMRPTELKDGIKLVTSCPDTRFILDHCGNADPKAFRQKTADTAWHDAVAWGRDIDRCAKQSNLICKISGIVARAPKNWTADDLAPIVNHCLDAFGPDRVIFGGDWPVCLLGASLRRWIDALAEIISNRPADQQRKLWHDNAQRFYGV